ncbi:hypothetical protein DSO57_1015575 [Entomophthora muscae]|uniref:Uncharacterized protein n=1 Tax=Entomophthora muscae TaxID=34485 RepID=A0ACC2TSR4_9FUNG|nr:hypothetical protein DSO57_1015575 [Entomophthora muscae]
MILPVAKFVVFSLAPFLLLLWSTSPALWGKISSSAWLLREDPSGLWDLSSGLLFSGEAVIKSLACNDLDLDIVDSTLPASVEELPLSKAQAQPASKVPTKQVCDLQSDYLVTQSQTRKSTQITKSNNMNR